MALDQCRAPKLPTSGVTCNTEGKRVLGRASQRAFKATALLLRIRSDSIAPHRVWSSRLPTNPTLTLTNLACCCTSRRPPLLATTLGLPSHATAPCRLVHGAGSQSQETQRRVSGWNWSNLGGSGQNAATRQEGLCTPQTSSRIQRPFRK